MFGFWPFSYRNDEKPTKQEENTPDEFLIDLQKENERLLNLLHYQYVHVNEFNDIKRSLTNDVNRRQLEIDRLQEELSKRDEQVKQLQELLAASISERDTMDTWNRGLSSDVERLHGEAILLKSDISKYRAIFQSNTELLVSTHNELKDYKDAVDTLVRFHQSKQPNQPSA
jgi:chromosome segregation ATPase